MRTARWVLPALLLPALASAGDIIEEKDASVRLILNDPLQFDRPGDRCKSEVCTSLLKLIKGAKTRIDFAIYGMRGQSALMDALIAAQKRGVAVRGIVDMDAEGKTYYRDTPELIDILGTVRSDAEHDIQKARHTKPYDSSQEQCRRPIGFDGPLQCLGYELDEDRCILQSAASREMIYYKGDIMHDKFFVVDAATVWTGSTNASDSGTGGYNSNLVTVIRSKAVAETFLREFDQMYVEGKFHDDKTSWPTTRVKYPGGWLEVLFSPQDKPITRKIRPMIQSAQQNIDIAVFFLTHKYITGDLIAAHRRGVKVRVILDATAATNGYTKHEILRAAGIPVKIENWGGKMHMKAAVIDDEHVITGSMNWTSAGEGGNDENTVLLHSRSAASQFRKYFDRIWRAIPDRWLEGRPAAESVDSPVACQDGVDNDYDKKKDDDDPGCRPDNPGLPPLPELRVVRRGSGEGMIKGDITRDGKKIYYTPGSRYYSRARIDEAAGERWFCSETEARASGWRKSWN